MGFQQTIFDFQVIRFFKDIFTVIEIEDLHPFLFARNFRQNSWSISQKKGPIGTVHSNKDSPNDGRLLLYHEFHWGWFISPQLDGCINQHSSGGRFLTPSKIFQWFRYQNDPGGLTLFFVGNSNMIFFWCMGLIKHWVYRNQYHTIFTR